MDRRQFYRVAFCVNAAPQGTMLICERSVEMSISRCAQVIGEGFSVHSVNPIFLSESEEDDFIKFVILGDKILADNVVDIKKRLRGMV